jgi:hypothetical protein
MAKSKKYISSKVKRKFAVGGPYKDVEAELYNPNADRTIYQAADQPSTILQQQQEAMLQQQAAANKSMYQNQLNAELARNQAQQQQTANLIEEEKTARKAEEQKQKQALATQATKGAIKLGKETAKNFTLNPDGKFINTALQSGSYYSPTWTSTTAAPTAPITAAPIVGTESVGTGALSGSIAPAGAVEVGQNLATTTSTGADVAGKAASGASLGSAAAGIGLGLAGEGLGMYATYKQRKEDDAAKRSQYYRDTDYTRREALGQIGKSTLKGAGIGVGAGTTLGLGVGSVPAGVVGGVIGGVAGLGYGVGKALHEERLTKSEADRGIKIGNKRIGKKLLFGDENVYSAAKDPYEIAKAQYQDSLEKQAQLASAMDAASLASRTTEVNTGFNVKGSNMAKYGGSIEYLKGGIAKPLPRGAKEYIGNKHEEGGIDLPGNINVEGGETEQDNYIFSATLKLPTGLTYAQAHKNLLASGASSEEIKQLALSQEAAAGRNPNEIKTMKFAKYGGPLMYKKGGPKESSPEPAKLTGDAGYWYIYDLAKKYGDPYPEVTAAQWAIESAWGTKLTGKNNPFGQTAKKGENSTNLDTPKDPSGGSKNFKNYISIEDSVKEHVQKWSPKYKNAKSAEEALYMIQNYGNTPRYAEGYATKEFPQGDWKQYIETATSIIKKRPISNKPKSSESSTSKMKISIPGAYGSMTEGYFDPQTGAITLTPEEQSRQQSIVNLKQEQDENVFNWGMGAFTSAAGGAGSLINAGRNALIGAGVNKVKETVSPNFRNTNTNTQVATEGQWIPYADAVNADTPGFAINYGNTGVGPYKGADYINITGRTIKTNEVGPYMGGSQLPVVDPRANIGFNVNPGKAMFQYKPISKVAEEEKQKLQEEENKKQNEETIINPEETQIEDTETTGTTDTSNLKNLFKLPTISKGNLNRPAYLPSSSTADAKKEEELKYKLSELPEDKKDYTGLLNMVPILAGTAIKPKYTQMSPALITGTDTAIGSVGRVNLGRVQLNAERAANQQNAAAINQALQNMSGPGAIAGMVATKTKADQQNLAIAQAEQNANVGLAAKEADLNTQISQRNIQNALAANNLNLQRNAQNAAILNRANEYNTDLENQRRYVNYVTNMNALQSGIEGYLGYKKDQDTLQRDKDVAAALDPYHALERREIEKKLKTASKDKNSEYYGIDPVTRRKMAQQYIKESYPDQMQFGGRKYVSRLGDLVNKRHKRF